MRAVLYSIGMYMRLSWESCNLGWLCCGRAWESVFLACSLGVVMLHPHARPWSVKVQGNQQRQPKDNSRKRGLLAHHRDSRSQLSVVLTVILTMLYTSWLVPRSPVALPASLKGAVAAVPFRMWFMWYGREKWETRGQGSFGDCELWKS